MQRMKSNGALVTLANKKKYEADNLVFMEHGVRFDDASDPTATLFIPYEAIIEVSTSKQKL